MCTMLRWEVCLLTANFLSYVSHKNQQCSRADRGMVRSSVSTVLSNTPPKVGQSPKEKGKLGVGPQAYTPRTRGGIIHINYVSAYGLYKLWLFLINIILFYASILMHYSILSTYRNKIQNKNSLGIGTCKWNQTSLRSFHCLFKKGRYWFIQTFGKSEAYFNLLVIENYLKNV